MEDEEFMRLARQVVDECREMMADWDAIRPTPKCLHCRGTGLAPSADGLTACGFCEAD